MQLERANAQERIILLASGRQIYNSREAAILFYEMEASMEAPAQPINGEPQYIVLLRNLLKVVKQAPKAYTGWVEKNPEQASKLETVVRVLGYILPVRFGAQQDHTELVYAASNFFSFYNDRLLASYYKVQDKLSTCVGSSRRVVYLLSILDYLEVAVELFALRKGSEPVKWLAVLLIVITKTILQSWIVYKKHYGLLLSPPIPAADRTKLKVGEEQGSGREYQQLQQSAAQPQAWRGPRTGSILRSIRGDPSIPYSELSQFASGEETLPTMQAAERTTALVTQLNRTQLLAEGLHIARPLVHILSMFVSGQDSWISWLIALGMDLSSLHLMGKVTQFNKAEKLELMRRRTVLLLYFLRSPFYDSYAKSIVLRVLKFLSAKVPLLHVILDPLLEYLPVWQKIYFYNWML